MPFRDYNTRKISVEGFTLPNPASLASQTWKWNYAEEWPHTAKILVTPLLITGVCWLTWMTHDYYNYSNSLLVSSRVVHCTSFKYQLEFLISLPFMPLSNSFHLALIAYCLSLVLPTLALLYRSESLQAQENVTIWLFVCWSACMVYRRNDTAVQVKLYEVLREGATAPSAADEDDDGLRLVHRRRVSARRPGWEVFKLRNVIQRWANDPSTNRGVLLNCTSTLLHSAWYEPRWFFLSITLCCVETCHKLFIIN